MTYYELINYIKNLYKKNINDDIIDKLNNIEIDLSKERYFRFENHYFNLIEYKINNIYYTFRKNIIDLDLNIDNFKNEFNYIENELNKLNKLTNINLITLEYTKNFNNKIIIEINKMLNRILKLTNNEEIHNEIKKHYLKELE